MSNDNRDTVLRRALTEIRQLRAALETAQRDRNEPIAVIGMGCRIPGADGPAAFWDLMRSGTDAVTEVPPARWDIDAYHADGRTEGKSYTRSAALLDDVDAFDAPFFGISPREAAHMDPQQRLFLEVGWEALENAGQAPDALKGSRTGVFVGVTGGDYLQSILQRSAPEDLDAYVLTGSASTFAAGRLSYWLGLSGPSLSVDTACSSSLVSVHLAVQSLRTGDCSMALAGGVNALLAPEAFVLLSSANMLSPDGRCKTFDKSANGYVRGEGCGVVVLKRLSDAVADGDHIHAVIRGSAINSDGRSSGITVPNGNAQQAVIRDALADAAVPGARIGYVEAHGTGTALGDPIELRALSAVLGPDRDAGSPVIVGSAKTNIGHLESAAGVAGLIKTVLALRNEQIPALLHLDEVNPEIQLDRLPVTLPTALTPWPRAAEPRFAGVSSFGASGTNAHVVLEEAPAPAAPAAAADRTEQLVTLSARSENALHALARRYAEHLRGDAGSLSDIAFTANTGRAKFPHRVAVRASSVAELRDRLGDLAGGGNPSGLHRGRAERGTQPKVGFLFTGQGAQYAGMGRELYRTDPGFRADLDRCAEILDALLDRPLLSVLFGDDADTLIDRTCYTQPAMFALQYGLARLWLRWGVRPAAMVGHSVGELAAACVAGVLRLEDGLRLVAERARLMGELPEGGAMAVVFADEPRVAAAIAAYPEELAIAAINGPANVVVSGVAERVDSVLAEFAGRGVKSRRLTVSHAFHSPLLDPMVKQLYRYAADIEFGSPRIPLVSNLTGDFLGAGGTTVDAGYIRDQARSPVRFADGLQRLVDRGCTVFVEIGPAPHLSSIAKNSLPHGEQRWLASLRRGKGEWTTLLDSVGELFTLGVAVDWAGFDQGYRRRRVELPTYPFERKRHWFTESRQSAPPAVSAAAASPDGPTLLGSRVSSPLDLVQYQAELSVARHPSLADCVSGDTTVVNAGFHLETVIAAAREIWPSGQTGVRAEGIVLPQALILPENGRLTTQLVVLGAGDSRRFTYHSRGSDGTQWPMHAQGTLVAATETPEILGADRIRDIAARCRTEIAGSTFYRELWQRRVHLGPSAQWLASIKRADGEALARIRPADAEELAQGYALHPGIVDSALQLLTACLPLSESGALGETVVMVMEIGEFAFFGYDGSELHCHAAMRPAAGGSDLVTADIVLTAPDGRQVARMSGVHLKATTQAALLAAIRSAPRRAGRVPVSWAQETAAGSSRLGTDITGLLAAGDRDAARMRLRELLTGAVAAVLECAPADVGPDDPLGELGLDSLLAVEVQQKVGVALAISPPAAWFLDLPSIAGLAEKLLDSMAVTHTRAAAADAGQGARYTGPGGMRMVDYGSGEPIVFVHGGAFGGPESWQTQLSLAERWRLRIVSRLGYDDSAPAEFEDYLTDGRLLAEALGVGAHVVAQSYGTLGAMIAAVARPEAVRSLTLIESAASFVARGAPAVDEYERAMTQLFAAPHSDPIALFRQFFGIIEPTATFPDPLPAAQHAFATRVAAGGRLPWEAEVPIAALRATGIPILVVSGGQRPVFEEISDALAASLGAERLVVPGGHGTQNTGTPFNSALEEFLIRASKSADDRSADNNGEFA
ncbi:beta-ketoacyl synthase N-terminal-like domain-containing protein [Nocardia sp. NPDC088792]|uniref:beta-ketoacyl synthase N-terminal-like domain-containing protein n=1 Tax=Nocardia sp. NPDC088792 TaxID=3364332 RepID=UPI00382014C7